MPDRGRYTLRTLQRGLAVLETLEGADRGLTLTEMAGRLRESPTVVFRLLRTLEAAGYVEQEPDTRRYTLGLRVFQLGARAAARMRLLEVARPALRWLAGVTGQTCGLVVLRGTEVLYLDVIEGSEPLRYYADPGSRAPAYATASGKAILAWHPEQVPGVIAAGLRRLARGTVTGPVALRRRLAEIRRSGLSVNLGERRDDIAAVAAPIFDARGECVAAISASGPRTRFGEDDREEYQRHVRKAAEEISARLGHHPEGGHGHGQVPRHRR